MMGGEGGVGCIVVVGREGGLKGESKWEGEGERGRVWLSGSVLFT